MTERNGNGGTKLVTLLLSALSVAIPIGGGLYTILRQPIDTNERRINDLEERVRQTELGASKAAEKAEEIETQFSQEARVRYLEIQALREKAGMEPLPWLGDGTRRDQ